MPLLKWKIVIKKEGLGQSKFNSMVELALNVFEVCTSNILIRITNFTRK